MKSRQHCRLRSVAKTERFENSLQTGEILKRRPCVLVWTASKRSHRDYHVIDQLFHPKKSKMTGEWRDLTSAVSLNGKHFGMFAQWKRRFQISPGVRVQGLISILWKFNPVEFWNILYTKHFGRIFVLANLEMLIRAISRWQFHLWKINSSCVSVWQSLNFVQKYNIWNLYTDLTDTRGA